MKLRKTMKKCMTVSVIAGCVASMAANAGQCSAGRRRERREAETRAARVHAAANIPFPLVREGEIDEGGLEGALVA